MDTEAREQVVAFFSPVFVLYGLLIMLMGIRVVVHDNFFLQVFGNIPNSRVAGNLIADAAYIFIGVGVNISMIGFLSCCGVWKKSKCLLVTYAVVVGILLALQIGCVVVAYSFCDTVIATVNTELAAVLNASYTSSFTSKTGSEFTYVPGSLVSKGIDAIQVKFGCCGVNNYTDYSNNDFPPTCCPTTDTDLNTLANKLWKDEMSTFTVSSAECFSGTAGNTTYLDMAEVGGCTQVITDNVRKKRDTVMNVGACTLPVQLLILIVFCSLFKDVRNGERE